MPGSQTRVYKKSMRKGTKSCAECRRRKIKCNWSNHDPNICRECAARGSPCRDQRDTLDSHRAAAADDADLHDKVSRLETLITSMARKLEPDSTSQFSRHDQSDGSSAAEALVSLKSSIFPLSPPSEDDAAEDEGEEVEEEEDLAAPLLSLFGRSVLRTNLDGSTGSQTKNAQSRSSRTRATHHRNSQIRASLLALLPPRPALSRLLEASAQWFQSWRPLTMMDVGFEGSKETLSEFVFFAMEQDVLMSALALQCTAIALLQIPRSFDEISLHLPMPASQLANQYLSVIEHVIIADDSLIGSLEGLNVISVQSKCAFYLSQPTRAWLLHRRSIAVAQNFGLHRERLRPGPHDERSLHRQSSWRSLCVIDRYMSLTIGRPSAVPDALFLGSEPDTPTDDGSDMTTDQFRRKQASLAGAIIDRNQSFLIPSQATTLQLDQRLNDLTNQMSASWWDIDAAKATGDLPPSELYDRILAAYWQWQMKAYIHLPMLLQSAQDRRFEYHRLACLEGARALLRVYHFMNAEESSAFYMVTILEFQAFTAAVIVLLSLLGFGAGGEPLNDNDVAQQRADWELIMKTRTCFQSFAAKRDDSVASQALSGLDALCSVRAESSQPGEGLKRKIMVPFFGLITLNPSSAFAARVSNGQTPATTSDTAACTPEMSSLLAHGPAANVTPTPNYQQQQQQQQHQPQSGGTALPPSHQPTSFQPSFTYPYSPNAFPGSSIRKSDQSAAADGTLVDPGEIGSSIPFAGPAVDPPMIPPSGTALPPQKQPPPLFDPSLLHFNTSFENLPQIDVDYWDMDMNLELDQDWQHFEDSPMEGFGFPS